MTLTIFHKAFLTAPRDHIVVDGAGNLLNIDTKEACEHYVAQYGHLHSSVIEEGDRYENCMRTRDAIRGEADAA